MKKYIFLILVPIVFSGCFGPETVEEQKENCLSQNKKFTSFEVMNYRTGKDEIRVVCR